MASFTFDADAFAESAVIEIAELSGDTLRTVELIFEAVGAQTIALLRSLTDEIRPPIGARSRARASGAESSTLGQRTRKGRLRKDGTRGPRTGPRETGRRAHPGHWADVTSNLVNAYAYAVERTADGVTLVLSNAMEYAAALEAHDGFFVLTGIEVPGGPVDTALRRAVALVAPDWTVV